MPIYEYICEHCAAKKEVFQGMKDAPLSQCDQCGKQTLKRLISAGAFRLKGGGWYETDFKKGGDKKKNLADEQSHTKPASEPVKSESTADSTAASTTTTASSTSSHVEGDS
jgi:putative FmdB family regulatory protein